MISKKRLHEIIRVNHAGEFGAKWIYKGQLAVLGRHATIEHMKAQEDVHLKMFNELAIENQVRPTIFQPLCAIGGFAMGALSALWGGEKGAHACTMAVEAVIERHYENQLCELSAEPALRQKIEVCLADEKEHYEQAKCDGGMEAPAYQTLTKIVKTITQSAIKTCEKF